MDIHIIVGVMKAVIFDGNKVCNRSYIPMELILVEIQFVIEVTIMVMAFNKIISQLIKGLSISFVVIKVSIFVGFKIHKTFVSINI